MKLHFKYMVGNRCRLALKAGLKKLGLNFVGLDTGEIEIDKEISAAQREHVKIALSESGFELMDDKKSILIQEIKGSVLEWVRFADEPHDVNFSDYLSEKLDHRYAFLSSLFSDITGITIEKYIIIQKIEWVKELLSFNELNLSEIAYKLHYSSVAYLSLQFRKITGLTPTFFKKLRLKKRVALANVGIM